MGSRIWRLVFEEIHGGGWIFVMNVYKASKEYQVKLKHFSLLQEKSFKTHFQRRISIFFVEKSSMHSSSHGKSLQLHFQINCRVFSENRFINGNNICPICRNKCKLLNINNHIECKKQNLEYHNCIIRDLAEKGNPNRKNTLYEK